MSGFYVSTNLKTTRRVFFMFDFRKKVRVFTVRFEFVMIIALCEIMISSSLQAILNKEKVNIFSNKKKTWSDI